MYVIQCCGHSLTSLLLLQVNTLTTRGRNSMRLDFWFLFALFYVHVFAAFPVIFRWLSNKAKMCSRWSHYGAGIPCGEHLTWWRSRDRQKRKWDREDRIEEEKVYQCGWRKSSTTWQCITLCCYRMHSGEYGLLCVCSVCGRERERWRQIERAREYKCVQWAIFGTGAQGVLVFTLQMSSWFLQA